MYEPRRVRFHLRDTNRRSGPQGLGQCGEETTVSQCWDDFSVRAFAKCKGKYFEISPLWYKRWHILGLLRQLCGMAQLSSEEHQLRSPPFYVDGVPWTVRLYRVKVGLTSPPRRWRCGGRDRTDAPHTVHDT